MNRMNGVRSKYLYGHGFRTAFKLFSQCSVLVFNVTIDSITIMTSMTSELDHIVYSQSAELKMISQHRKTN